MVYLTMKHLAEILIFVFPSYYTNNLFTDETPKGFAMQPILQKPIPHSDGGVGH